MTDFRKSSTAPPATGNSASVIFVSTTEQRPDNVFDMFVVDAAGKPARLDRIAVKMTSAASPPALPRYGDAWLDTATDHVFQWLNNGVQDCWMDIS